MDQQTLDQARQLQSNIKTLKQNIRDIDRILDPDREDEQCHIHRVVFETSFSCGDRYVLEGLREDNSIHSIELKTGLFIHFLEDLKERFERKLSTLEQKFESL